MVTYFRSKTGLDRPVDRCSGTFPRTLARVEALARLLHLAHGDGVGEVAVGR